MHDISHTIIKSDGIAAEDSCMLRKGEHDVPVCPAMVHHSRCHNMAISKKGTLVAQHAACADFFYQTDNNRSGRLTGVAVQGDSNKQAQQRISHIVIVLVGIFPYSLCDYAAITEVPCAGGLQHCCTHKQVCANHCPYFVYGTKSWHKITFSICSAGCFLSACFWNRE